MPPLPAHASAWQSATWDLLAPHYQELVDAPLTDATLRAWVARWSALDATIDEAHALAMNAYTANTRDADAEAVYLRWGNEISPRLQEVRVQLGRRLLPFRTQLPDLGLFLREVATDVELFREANLPRLAALEEMSATYEKIAGGLTVTWDGATKTVPELQPFLHSPDRGVRERAFRAGAQAYLAHRDELAELMSAMIRTRHAVAREAGFADYRDYAFRAKCRFDYTPEDCMRFHAAIETAVVPAVRRLDEERRRRLGVETLRPWDLVVSPDRTAPLVPFTDAAELVAGGQRIFDAVDPELGDYFRTMAHEELLDLPNRPGKAPGGYCVKLPARGRPFIFMNAVGVPDDVATLVHESGHAFHAFLTAGMPYIWPRDTPHEAAELASMSMELLAAPYLARPTGFYAVPDAADAQLEHLELLLRDLPHIASVDAFQHWLYTEGVEATPDERDAAWLRVRTRFEAGTLDWSGLERERIARWYRQPHIFTSPFYYIEYGLAQLGALQVWRASLRDPERALRCYKAALALGYTVPLPEIYETAGASLLFEAAPMARLVSEVEARIAELRAMHVASPVAS